MQICIERPSAGFVFGRDDNCDILLGRNGNGSRTISRMHFSISLVVHHGEPSFLLKSFSRFGTTIRSSSLGNRHVKTQRSIPPCDRELVVDIGSFQLRFEFPNHGENYERWRQLVLRYCDDSNSFRAPPLAPLKINTNNINWREHYTITRTLGAGTFGAVYRVRHNWTGAVYAIKELKDARCRRSEIKLKDLLQLKHVCHINPDAQPPPPLCGWLN
jgi:hypothetical protein